MKTGLRRASLWHDTGVSLLVRGGVILTMNDRFDIIEGDVSVRDGRVAAIGSTIGDRHDRVIEARGAYVLPGFIQTHIHLCQTLFRGYADDFPLMEWLARRVWPMEAAHTPATLRASANLAAYLAVSEPGQTLLGMSLAHGGHLTHGHSVSLTGKLWKSVQYGVRPDDGYLEALHDLLHAHGALLTFDEVKTGFTVGPGGASGRLGVTSDLVCVAKAMGVTPLKDSEILLGKFTDPEPTGDEALVPITDASPPNRR